MAATGTFLDGVRVLELADELGEYCGKVLAGLGADVVKIEPPGGEATRGYGPFVDDEPHPDRSLYFWHYNFGKRSATVDLNTDDGRTLFRELAAGADVLIDTRPRDFLAGHGFGWDELHAMNPGLIYVRISPFGDDGPWADYRGSDLVHLALGGVMMNCGYDPTPAGEYDTPPVAPQMWQAYHIVGELTSINIIAALAYRNRTSRGQRLSASVHQAVSTNTESDLPDWVYTRRPHNRLTCRHSFAPIGDDRIPRGFAMSRIVMTKDGRWVLPYRTYLPGWSSDTSTADLVALLRKHGVGDIVDDKYSSPEYLRTAEAAEHIDVLVETLMRSYLNEREVWRDGQQAGFAWSPVRRPEENLADPHWQQRGSFVAVEHPEVGRTFAEVGSRWVSDGLPWRSGPRAPLVDEHTDEIRAEVRAGGAGRPKPPTRPSPAAAVRRRPVATSRRGTPFALDGVRVIDLGWMLASAGAGRFLAALGAEVIKVEHLSKIDMMRFAGGPVPDGGREQRDRATGPIFPGRSESPNRSGHFLEINAGKRSLSLNLKQPRARELLTELLRDADIVVEGYSPGTMERMGFGYDVLRKINPRLVYVQQSGLGQLGNYGRYKSFGPTAQAFSGISEMSGLPDPYPPAGIGYSYLDWFGAYQMASAMMAGLYRQQRTGEGCWIDSSQVEAGLYLTGTAVLDHAVNGRQWRRYGNRSPYKPAAPSGAYRVAGTDRWIAISVFDDAQWLGLARTLDREAWLADPAFATSALRLTHQDRLDAEVAEATAGWDGPALMAALQSAGVAAGLCQNAEDRCISDPQLAHLHWQVELEQSEVGRWPVKEVPVLFSETPAYIGGAVDRHGPSYGEDTDYVLGDVLGLSAADIAELRRAGVI